MMQSTNKVAVVVMVAVVALFQPAFGQPVNKYSDPVIREIHDIADRRDAENLLPFLRHSNPEYRGEALFCFGSIQAPGLADSLFAAMQVEQQRVRMMGAWAIGQSGQAEAVTVIRKALEDEKDPAVRGMLYEALGKCGSEEDLNWLAGMEIPFEETEGLAVSILRFGLRGIQSLSGNSRVLKIQLDGTSFAGSVYASYFLGRYAAMDWLQTKSDSIDQAFGKEKNDQIRAGLIKAVIRAKDEKAWLMCKNILESDGDYRIKVNILNSMKLMPWNKAVKTVLKLAEGADPNISVAAAEAVQQNAVYTDLPVLLKSIDATSNWRSRSLILGKTLELVSGKPGLVKKVLKMIIESVESAKSLTEKAWYIRTLVSEPAQYAFVEARLKRSEAAVVYTNCLETLDGMSKSKNYSQAARDFLLQGIDLAEELKRIAATYPMPVDPKPGFNHPIDWDRVLRLSPKQKVAIKTNRGEIIIQLNLTWCPGTCAAFTELMDTGFYRNLTIHRVVPNFVMQDGCPRGDGWGGPEWTIRSEFTPAPFLEGTVGMASSGKDTEGSQWYVTHSPTPHLDAKYTNFGFVIAGMETVHELEVGDTILSMELIRE